VPVILPPAQTGPVTDPVPVGPKGAEEVLVKGKGTVTDTFAEALSIQGPVIDPLTHIDVDNGDVPVGPGIGNVKLVSGKGAVLIAPGVIVSTIVNTQV